MAYGSENKTSVTMAIARGGAIKALCLATKRKGICLDPLRCAEISSWERSIKQVVQSDPDDHRNRLLLFEVEFWLKHSPRVKIKVKVEVYSPPEPLALPELREIEGFFGLKRVFQFYDWGVNIPDGEETMQGGGETEFLLTLLNITSPQLR
jgi:hypothetical protein